MTPGQQLHQDSNYTRTAMRHQLATLGQGLQKLTWGIVPFIADVTAEFDRDNRDSETRMMLIDVYYVI